MKPTSLRGLRPVFTAWALLVVCTLVSVSDGMRSASPAMLAAVAGLTACKVTLVIFRFMEVERAPLWLRAACLAWIAIIFCMIGALVAFPQWSVEFILRR
ncbi:MAG: cytochrome C oxidase subunit IV family protein [Pseudomonadota bacterium]